MKIDDIKIGEITLKAIIVIIFLILGGIFIVTSFEEDVAEAKT